MSMRILLALFATAALVPASPPYAFQVVREKLLRDEPGHLTIDESAVRYRSDKGTVAIMLPFTEIRTADVSDGREIRIETYDIAKMRLGGRSTLSFRLREGSLPESLGQFLAAHMQRPVISSYPLPNERAFQIPAYRRELLGGSHGTLQIGPDGIQFASKKPKDSRTWLYRDIETIGTKNPFHFRITTFSEGFTFDLKERLPDGAYELAWSRVYRLENTTSSSWNRKQ